MLLRKKLSKKPYINFGTGNAIIIAENKNKNHIEFSYGSEEERKAFYGPKKYEFTVLSGAGLTPGRIQMELRYATSKKCFSPYFTVDVNAKSSQLIFTYQF